MNDYCKCGRKHEIDELDWNRCVDCGRPISQPRGMFYPAALSDPVRGSFGHWLKSD